MSLSRLVFLTPLISAWLASGPAAAAEDGRALFAANCSACHQPAGQGIAGAFPALAGNAFVQGAPSVAAATVLNGRGGMPSFKADLSDAQIAAILSFVRQSWGNTAGPVAEADVAAGRSTSRADAGAPALQAH